MGRIVTTIGRTHRDDKRTVKRSGWFAWSAGAIHGDVAAQLDVSQRNPGVGEGPLEAEAAAQQEPDEGPLPHLGERVDLRCERAIPIHTVARDIGPQVGTRCDVPRLG
jgi:hypothetical protein